NTSITSGYTSTISTSQNTNLSSTSKSTLELQLLKKTTKKIVKKTITVYITKTGHKYHRSGCRYLSRSKIAISLKDAKAEGYGACSVCNPPA
ncbi:MAG: nuclease (SNase), partial [Clostridiales bacterium]|nr:nuclease (SNase) [Clostridiales bacterium]